MDFNLKIWRQKNAQEKGHFETYHISGIEVARAVFPCLSTTIAVREYAELAPFTLTAAPMVRTTM